MVFVVALVVVVVVAVLLLPLFLYFWLVALFVFANGAANDPSRFPNFPCCLTYMPQLLGSCHAFSVSGAGVGVGVGGIKASLARPHICDATLLYVLVHLHSYVMLRYCMFFCISTYTSCYATIRSPAFPHICDARLLYVLSHFHTYVMLCYCTFSCISTHM